VFRALETDRFGPDDVSPLGRFLCHVSRNMEWRPTPVGGMVTGSVIITLRLPNALNGQG
jgi:hypothetical protein